MITIGEWSIFKYFVPCASEIRIVCLMFIPIDLLELHVEILWGKRWHVSPRTPPGLGRTQGCGFWVDIGALIFLFAMQCRWSPCSTSYGCLPYCRTCTVCKGSTFSYVQSLQEKVGLPSTTWTKAYANTYWQTTVTCEVQLFGYKVNSCCGRAKFAARMPPLIAWMCWIWRVQP